MRECTGRRAETRESERTGNTLWYVIYMPRLYEHQVPNPKLSWDHYPCGLTLDLNPECPKPRLHGHSDPDPDPDWLRLHGGKLDSNPDSDHLSHVDCDPDSNPDSGPGARVNGALDLNLDQSDLCVNASCVRTSQWICCFGDAGIIGGESKFKVGGPNH